MGSELISRCLEDKTKPKQPKTKKQGLSLDLQHLYVYMKTRQSHFWNSVILAEGTYHSLVQSHNNVTLSFVLHPGAMISHRKHSSSSLGIFLLQKTEVIEEAFPG